MYIVLCAGDGKQKKPNSYSYVRFELHIIQYYNVRKKRQKKKNRCPPLLFDRVAGGVLRRTTPRRTVLSYARRATVIVFPPDLSGGNRIIHQAAASYTSSAGGWYWRTVTMDYYTRRVGRVDFTRISRGDKNRDIVYQWRSERLVFQSKLFRRNTRITTLVVTSEAYTCVTITWYSLTGSKAVFWN